MTRSEYKQMSKRLLIERDAVWRFNEFDLLTFVVIRQECQFELMYHYTFG